MITASEPSGCSLFTAMFSDEPVPDVEAAVVVAHPGNESANASWLLVRLGERASVFCLTNTAHLDAMFMRDMRRTTPHAALSHRRDRSVFARQRSLRPGETGKSCRTLAR
jgi:hypothetical protein